MSGSGSGRHRSLHGLGGTSTSPESIPGGYAYVDQMLPSSTGTTSTGSQQHLHPEDVYRIGMDRDGSGSYMMSMAHSPRGSESHSPQRRRHHSITPPGGTAHAQQHQASRHASNSPASYVEYPYTDLSTTTTHTSTGGDSGFTSSRRVTPPDQGGGGVVSRHSSTGSYHSGSSPRHIQLQQHQQQQQQHLQQQQLILPSSSAAGGKNRGKGKGREEESSSSGSHSNSRRQSSSAAVAAQQKQNRRPSQGRHGSVDSGGSANTRPPVPFVGPQPAGSRLVNGVFIRY